MCGKNGQPATASSSTGKTSPVNLAYVQNSVLLLFLQCAFLYDYKNTSISI